MAESVQDKQLSLFDEFPNVEVSTTEGKFKLYDFQGTNWLMIFSHPKCYTPVCTTEQIKVAKMKSEWEKRKCKVVSLVIDKVERIAEWKKDLEELAQGKIDIPMIEDADQSLAKQLGMFHPQFDMKVTARTVYILSPDKKIKLILQYPGSVGRNFDEVLRVLDGLQLSAVEKIATPEGWKPGDKACVVPSLNDEQAKQVYPQGWDAPKPYLRLVDVNKKK